MTIKTRVEVGHYSGYQTLTAYHGHAQVRNEKFEWDPPDVVLLEEIAKGDRVIIEYVNKPTPEVQLAAVTLSAMALQRIAYPTDAAKALHRILHGESSTLEWKTNAYIEPRRAQRRAQRRKP